MAYFIVNRNVGRLKEWWGFDQWWDSLDDMLAHGAAKRNYQGKLFYIYIPHYMSDGSPSIWCDTAAIFPSGSCLPKPYTFSETLDIIRLYAPLLQA